MPNLLKLLLAVVLAASTLTVSAEMRFFPPEPDTAVYEWQKQRLIKPNFFQRQKELKRQEVFIYEGMTTEDVEEAMEDHFDRVEHMMFVKTRDEDGEEDDDCED